MKLMAQLKKDLLNHVPLYLFNMKMKISQSYPLSQMIAYSHQKAILSAKMSLFQ